MLNRRRAATSDSIPAGSPTFSPRSARSPMSGTSATICWRSAAIAARSGQARSARRRRCGAVALLCDGHARSRRDVVLRSQERDGGEGVLYRIRNGVRADGATKPVLIEDVGRWFAGPDGRPARAHGIMRVIDERHVGGKHPSARRPHRRGETPAVPRPPRRHPARRQAGCAPRSPCSSSRSTILPASTRPTGLRSATK